jgi:hypothetical protein
MFHWNPFTGQGGTPPECSWISMKTSGILLHILQICTSYFIHLHLIIFNFFAFPLFQWNFYVRLQGVPISYPQLLLNLWVDFNENCRHSSTYIGDVHPKAMQMLYEIWLFSIVLVSHIEKWMLSLSLLDLWMDFNETCVNQLLNGNI